MVDGRRRRPPDVPAAEVRRAAMLRGDLGRGRRGRAGRRRGGAARVPARRSAARSSRCWRRPAHRRRRTRWRRLGEAAVEWKLDGARIQVHRTGGEVAVYTRSLDDITARVPEVVDGRRWRCRCARSSSTARRSRCAPDGRPRPFQVTGSRVGRRLDVERRGRRLPLSPFFFDVPAPGRRGPARPPGGASAPRRWRAAVPEPLRVPRMVTADAGGRRGVLGRRAGARPRGRGGQVARRALRGRPARGRLAQGQAARTRSTSSCWPPSGATAGAGAGCRTCTSARATRPAGS